MKITGTVFSGCKGCSRACEQGLYNEADLGFKPYPGSLNIYSSVGIVNEIIRQYKSYKVNHFNEGDLWIWRGRIVCDEFIPCAIMWPDPKKIDIEKNNVLEIFAPVCLRDKFRFKDGDTITVEIRRSYLTKEEYLSFTEKHKDEAHWSGAISRWEYHQIATEILSSIDEISLGLPPSILEAGTMGIKLWKFSDTIDLSIPPDWPLYYTPTYTHNLSVLPWPINDRQYDAFVALRVFHRFSPTYLNEMRRIAKHIILALTDSTVEGFKSLRKPEREIRCSNTNTVVLYWRD